MKFKDDMFMDEPERKEVYDSIRLLQKIMKKEPLSDWVQSGSMMVRYDRDLEAYEVFLLRGHIFVKNREER
jgi:hypothetical protein